MALFHHPHASFHHLHAKRTSLKATRSIPVSKASLKISKTKHRRGDEELVGYNFGDEDDDDIASSFLQFCAMCEKQIVIPNNTILYCSESCRRKDAQVHDANPSLSMLNPQPFSPGSESKESNSTTCISISYKLPTARPLDPRIPPRSHNGKADLDPTEWKPADREGEFVGVKASTWKPKLVHPPRCEAYSYLSQFHRSAPSTNLLSATTIWSTPSLSHTTTTTSRSDDSIASTPSKLTMPFIVFKQEASLSTTVLTTDAELSSPSLIAVSDGRIMYSKCDEAGSINPDNLICQKKTVRDGKGSAAASLKQLLEKDTLDKSTPITT